MAGKGHGKGNARKPRAGTGVGNAAGTGRRIKQTADNAKGGKGIKDVPYNKPVPVPGSRKPEGRIEAFDFFKVTDKKGGNCINSRPGKFLNTGIFPAKLNKAVFKEIFHLIFPVIGRSVSVFNLGRITVIHIDSL
jgi:hypothetical protein